LYKPVHPNWFYSYVDIPNLEVIRQELIDLVNAGESGVRTNPTAYNISKEDVIENCQEVVKYLKKMQLLDKFDRLLITKKTTAEADGMVHVDTYDPKYLTQSLNIGLIDYEGSYTSWHSTDIKVLHDTAQFGMVPDRNFAFIEVEKTKEICRLYYDKRAALVNTTILHKGNAQQSNRIICGFRFVPDLSDEDIKRMGIVKLV